MKAWLSGEHEYMKWVIPPKLQRQFSDPVRKLLVGQAVGCLGGTPISWRWEPGEKGRIVLGAAL